jgi:hypothetical protein
MIEIQHKKFKPTREALSLEEGDKPWDDNVGCDFINIMIERKTATSFELSLVEILADRTCWVGTAFVN